MSRAVAQAVSPWPRTAETRVKCQDSPCEIFCGQNGTGIGVSAGTPVGIIARVLHTDSSLTLCNLSNWQRL